MSDTRIPLEIVGNNSDLIGGLIEHGLVYISEAGEVFLKANAAVVETAVVAAPVAAASFVYEEGHEEELIELLQSMLDSLI